MRDGNATCETRADTHVSCEGVSTAKVQGRCECVKNVLSLNLVCPAVTSIRVLGWQATRLAVDTTVFKTTWYPFQLPNIKGSQTTRGPAVLETHDLG